MTVDIELLNIIVPANGQFEQSSVGRMMQLKSTNGDLSLQLGSGDIWPMGQAIDFDSVPYESFIIHNDNAFDLEIELWIGTGEIKTNSFQLTGTVDIGADIISGATNALRIYDGYTSNMKALMDGGTEGLVQGVHILGDNIVNKTTTGESDLITAAENTDGVLIRTLGLMVGNNGHTIELKIDANIIYKHKSDAGRTAPIALPLPLRVAAGKAVKANHSDANGNTYISWDSLA